MEKRTSAIHPLSPHPPIPPSPPPPPPPPPCSTGNALAPAEPRRSMPPALRARPSPHALHCGEHTSRDGRVRAEESPDPGRPCTQRRTNATEHLRRLLSNAPKWDHQPDRAAAQVVENKRNPHDWRLTLSTLSGANYSGFHVSLPRVPIRSVARVQGPPEGGKCSGRLRGRCVSGTSSVAPTHISTTTALHSPSSSIAPMWVRGPAPGSK
jgi:hypothetical protein